jgi:cytochrome c5
LVLGGLSVVWLLGILRRDPDYGRSPRLAAAVDGGAMERFLDSTDEKETILRWVERSSPEREWPEVSAVFEARCVTCHVSDEEQFEVLALDLYASAAAASRVRPVLEEKVTGGAMGKYLDSAAEQSAIVAWIASGAPEKDWLRVRDILAAHCVQCHNPEGVAGIPSLDAYAPAARLARLPEPRRLPLWHYVGSTGALSVSILLAGWSMRRV